MVCLGFCAVDDKSWSTDVEFARQMLAGLNPMVIHLLKVRIEYII